MIANQNIGISEKLMYFQNVTFFKPLLSKVFSSFEQFIQIFDEIIFTSDGEQIGPVPRDVFKYMDEKILRGNGDELEITFRFKRQTFSDIILTMKIYKNAEHYEMEFIPLDLKFSEKYINAVNPDKIDVIVIQILQYISKELMIGL